MGSRRRLSGLRKALLRGACARGRGAWQHTISSTNLMKMFSLWLPLTRNCLYAGGSQ